MAEREENSLEPLKQLVRDIYQPLIGLQFTAWYHGRKEIMCTEWKRDTFVMHNVGRSEEASDAVTEILARLRKETYKGRPLISVNKEEEVIWRGITTAGRHGYNKLWAPPLQVDYVKLHDREYNLRVLGIGFFKEKMIKTNYKVGVNIWYEIDVDGLICTVNDDQ